VEEAKQAEQAEQVAPEGTLNRKWDEWRAQRLPTVRARQWAGVEHRNSQREQPARQRLLRFGQILGCRVCHPAWLRV